MKDRRDRTQLGWLDRFLRLSRESGTGTAYFLDRVKIQFSGDRMMSCLSDEISETTPSSLQTGR